MKPQIEESWLEALSQEFEKDYFNNLKTFLKEEKLKHTIFSSGKKIFTAFNLCPLHKVKVVIIGQDPYHGPGQAHGLCFSVPEGIPLPPSLKNIYKELNNDLGIPISKTGNLENWAKQGVLLLNSILTVRANQAASHHNKGWETFTDKAIKTISDLRAGVVFLLWGNYAINKRKLIDTNRHFVFTSVHPSPLSAHRGFFGCNHFSKTNKILKDNELGEINWNPSL
ncbi:MAG: uracil-DNA glycosylase [Marinilabiliales bacterium]|nr:MAG: uracil-DNA glycosylase [Marinilabiliales bacterium]